MRPTTQVLHYSQFWSQAIFSCSNLALNDNHQNECAPLLGTLEACKASEIQELPPSHLQVELSPE